MEIVIYDACKSCQFLSKSVNGLQCADIVKICKWFTGCGSPICTLKMAHIVGNRNINHAYLVNSVKICKWFSCCGDPIKICKWFTGCRSRICMHPPKITHIDVNRNI